MQPSDPPLLVGLCAGDPYVFNAAECARRTLKTKAINMLSSLEDSALVDMILQRFREATNMTDQVGHGGGSLSGQVRRTRGSLPGQAAC